MFKKQMSYDTVNLKWEISDRTNEINSLHFLMNFAINLIFFILFNPLN